MGVFVRSWSAVVSAVARLSLLVAVTALPAAGAGESTRRPADADEGGSLYVTHCAACHGVAGRGDGPATADLVAPVPDLGGRFTEASVDAAEAIVRDGRGAMPAFREVLDGPKIRRVLRHVAAVASAPAPAPPPAPPPPTEDAPGAP